MICKWWCVAFYIFLFIYDFLPFIYPHVIPVWLSFKEEKISYFEDTGKPIDFHYMDTFSKFLLQLSNDIKVNKLSFLSELLL